MRRAAPVRNGGITSFRRAVSSVQSHVLHRHCALEASPPGYVNLHARRSLRAASTYIGFDASSDTERDARKITQRTQTAVKADEPAVRSFLDLRSQGYVNQEPSADSGLLVDKPSHRNILDFWAELLEFRQRLHGTAGVKDIFHGMRRRDVDLPMEGERAHIFWIPFVEAASDDDACREQLWAFAKRKAQKTGSWWHGMYSGLLTPLLKHQPALAERWATTIRRDAPTLLVKGSLRDLLEPALSSARSLQAYKTLYKKHSDRDAYDWLIPYLCEQDLLNQAVDFHYLLLYYGDFPSSSSVVEPLAKYVALFSDQSTFTKFRQSLAKVSRNLAAPMSTLAVARFTGKHSEGKEEDDDDVVDTSVERPVSSRTPVSDQTAARAFATKAFSLKFIITGLISFNFQQLGVSAMRELAVRCENIDEFANHLERLRKEDIVVEDRIYTRLLQRLAFDRNQSMFTAVLQSDMHPDVYDDRHLQKRLLRQYTRQKDWAQLHRTLTVLTTIYQNPSEQAWNILLRGYMMRTEWPMIETVLSDMINQRITVTEQTIKKSFFWLMPERAPSKGIAPARKTQVDALEFLTSLWLRILESGGHVPAYAWRQVLTSYGTSGRLKELESLSLALSSFYAPSRDVHGSSTRMAEQFTTETVAEKEQTLQRIQRFRSPTPGADDLSSIFTPQKQLALVEWGFKSLGQQAYRSETNMSSKGLVSTNASSAIIRNQDTSSNRQDMQWDRGLVLLKTLSRRGLKVDYQAVRKAVRHRLQVLFHPLYVTTDVQNLRARKSNPWTLAQMVKHIHKVAGRDVLGVPTRLILDQSEDAQIQLAAALLGSRRLRRRHEPYKLKTEKPKVIEAGLRPAPHALAGTES